ncbi:MAG TPA: LytTR family DNA-binding domain-containing protein [Gemmatimonadaceae bacterium]|nr:LytTR family DNA-binding domain-containing protein [Gemmatimonadaceae bacterium]
MSMPDESRARPRAGAGASAGTLRVLLVDDEPLVRRGLRAFLAEEPDVTVVGEARDGNEAVDRIRSLRPDIVFLDVQMPERDGFGVLAALAPEERPAIVFVTAFDAYAVRAFDVHAVDYLVKPFDEERFRTALARVRERHARRSDGESGDAAAAPALRAADLDALLRALRAAPAGGPYLERLLVKERDRTVVLPVDEVDWFEAADNYVRLHTRAGTPLVRETIKTLDAALDPRRFARVHRSAIVRLAQVRALEPLFHGDMAVVLRDGTRLTLGRRHREEFEARLRRGWGVGPSR